MISIVNLYVTSFARDSSGYDGHSIQLGAADYQIKKMGKGWWNSHAPGAFYGFCLFLFHCKTHLQEIVCKIYVTYRINSLSINIVKRN